MNRIRLRSDDLPGTARREAVILPAGRYLQAKEPAVAPVKEGGETPAYGSIYFRRPDTDPPTLTVKFRRP